MFLKQDQPNNLNLGDKDGNIHKDLILAQNWWFVTPC